MFLAVLGLWYCIVPWASDPPLALATDRSSSGLACTFTIDEREFNLCPLINAHAHSFEISIDEETPPTHTKNVYTVGLSGPLTREATLPANLQCPEGTRICLTVANTRPDHPSEPLRILQVVPVAGDPGLKPKAILGDKIDSPHAPLQVTLHGGSYMRQSQKATFQFQCDYDVKEPSTPSFLWKWNGTHAFSWRTKHACYEARPTPQPPDHDLDPDPPVDPPQDPESGAGEEVDLTTPHSSRITLPVALLLTIPCLLMLRLLYSWLSRRRCRGLYHDMASVAIVSRMRILPFLRYFQPARQRGHADVTANSTLYNSFYDGEEGEEVPLTPNPGGTFGKRGRQYGSF